MGLELTAISGRLSGYNAGPLISPKPTGSWSIPTTNACDHFGVWNQDYPALDGDIFHPLIPHFIDVGFCGLNPWK